MILFALYAMLVWALAARYRRRREGVIAVLVGSGLAAFLGLDTTVSMIPVDMRVLVLAEAGIILAVGLFITGLPAKERRTRCVKCAGPLVRVPGRDARHPVCTACEIQHGDCDWCGHSLDGLPLSHAGCPECGGHSESYTPAGGAIPSASALAGAKRAAMRAAMRDKAGAKAVSPGPSDPVDPSVTPSVGRNGDAAPPVSRAGAGAAPR